MANPTVNAVVTTPAKTMSGTEWAVRTGAPLVSMGYEIGKALTEGKSLNQAFTGAYDKQCKVYNENIESLKENFKNLSDDKTILGFILKNTLIGRLLLDN